MPRRDELVSEAEARALWERASEMQQEAARREEERAATLERGRGSRLLLPDQPPALELARVIRAAPEAVLEAVKRIFPAEPYSMVLEDTVGDDPLQNGVYLFRVPGMDALYQGNSFSYEMACATVSHLLLTIRPHGPAGAGAGGAEPGKIDPGGTEVILRAPLLEHTRQSYWVSVVTTGVLGAGGGGVGVVAGLATAGALAGAPLLAGVGMTAAAALRLGAGGGLGVWSGRAIYRWGIGKGETALENLLKVLDAHALTGGAFPAGGEFPSNVAIPSKGAIPSTSDLNQVPGGGPEDPLP